ncbi:MAG: CHAT domain-containing protein [Acidobacteria bacterium]|nr:CHAT domain-containing protein [Acidobacteriota bacterium]
MTAGQKHSYWVTAPSGHFSRLIIQPGDFAVRFAVYDPNGELTREGRSRPFGPTPISWKASIDGNYRVEIFSPDGSGQGGRYTIRFEESQAAASNDEMRIVSELAVSEAELLSEKQDSESNRLAIEKYTQALSDWRRLGDRREEVFTLISIGRVLYFSGENQRALENFQQALEISQSLNDKEGLAEAHYNIANVQSDWGNLQTARENFEKASGLWRSLNLLRGQMRCKITLAIIAIKLGEQQRAIDLYRQALEIIRGIGAKTDEAAALNGLGEVYFETGDDLNAIDYAERALAIVEKIGALVPQKLAHTTIGQAYGRVGNTQKALAHARRELELSKKIGDPRLEAYALNQLGTIYESIGNRPKALSHYGGSLRLSREARNRAYEAAMLNRIGFIHELNGDKRKALAHYREALPISRETENRAEEVNALHHTARAQRDLGALAEARAQVETAIKLIESTREQFASRQLRESYFATAQKSYGLYIDVLMLQHKQRPEEGLNKLALQVSERARARSFREMLVEARADLRNDVPPQLFERERSLQKDLNNKAARQQEMLSGPHSPEEAERAARELRALKIEYDETQRQIKQAAPRYSALTQPQSLTGEEIQRRLLDNDTALLEYALGDVRSYLWLVTPHKIVSYQLPARAVIERAAKRAYSLLVTRQSLSASNPKSYEQALLRAKNAELQYWVEARALSRMLISPVVAELKGQRLIIVSDGALQQLPFGALPLPSEARSKSRVNGPARRPPEPLTPLIANHEIISLPSASMLAELRSASGDRPPASKTVAVIANPVFSLQDGRFAGTQRQESKQPPPSSVATDLLRAWQSNGGKGDIPQLPSSGIEGSEIIKLVAPESGLLATGFDASRSLIESQRLGDYRIIHFATHGLLNSDQPELSGLILSLYSPAGEKVDGFLRMHEIYNLRLSADLVVLSACQTGVGKEVKGEGLVALTRGFMYAGTRRVVASLWKVDDASTAALMQNFYSYLLKEGRSPADALRHAQLKIMGQNKRWSSPYYWAAFTVQGEYR